MIFNKVICGVYILFSVLNFADAQSDDLSQLQSLKIDVLEHDIEAHELYYKFINLGKVMKNDSMVWRNKVNYFDARLRYEDLIGPDSIGLKFKNSVDNIKRIKYRFAIDLARHFIDDQQAELGLFYLSHTELRPLEQPCGNGVVSDQIALQIVKSDADLQLHNLDTVIKELAPYVFGRLGYMFTGGGPMFSRMDSIFISALTEKYTKEKLRIEFSRIESSLAYTKKAMPKSVSMSIFDNHINISAMTIDYIEKNRRAGMGVRSMDYINYFKSHPVYLAVMK